MEDDKLTYMKNNIIQSFKWQKEVFIPTSKEFGVEKEVMEKFYMDNLDMSTLEALFGYLETSRELELAHRFHYDLRITFFCDALHFIDEESANKLKAKLAHEVAEGKKYEDVLKEGREELYLLMKDYLK